MAELASGAEFAGHRIEAVAGRGGMGIVYKATDMRLKRLVAMKVIAPELAQDEEFRERFERESQLAASLDHTNVIPIHHAGEEAGVLFITMRYVKGTDLSALIAKEGRIEPERAVRIVLGVAGALDAAHEQGLIHRDVKPANILIEQHDGREHVYLTDFGLTKHAGASGPTRTGFAVGTFDYMAPEQFLAKPIDARADVYALGCVLFEALTGKVPFPRPGDAARMYAHIQETPPRPSEITPGLPAGFDDVVAKALAKDPDDRYPSAGELAEAASAVLGGVTLDAPLTPRPSTQTAPTVSTPLPAPPPTPPPSETKLTPGQAEATSPPPAKPPLPGSSPSSERRRPILIGAGVLAALAGLVALVIVIVNSFGESSSIDTPEGTVKLFLSNVADGDGSAACQQLNPEAQIESNNAPGEDCGAGILMLTGRVDNDSKADAIRNTSFEIQNESRDAANATLQFPNPQAVYGSQTVPITISLVRSDDAWLISEIGAFCQARNVAGC